MNTFFFDDVQYPEGLFGGKDFFNPIIYSTEEREVGVWTDNKPLYEKTVYYNNAIPYRTWTTLVDDSSITIVDHEGAVYLNGSPYSDMDYHRGVDSNEWVCSCTTDNGTKLQINQSFYGDTITCRATYRYTKLADTAGSGSYTTLGVPAHHYDGNEKIIGTYFGETLYERTLNFTQDNRIYYIPNTTYVKKLVKHNGECTKDNFDYQIPYYDGTDNLSVGNDSNGVRIYSSNYFVGAVYELTIQYTKTT